MTDKKSEFIERLFDAFSNDPAIPAELKVAILRLQLPVHQLSQIDNHFFSNEKHPVRRTLFSIKKLSQHTASNKNLITKINSILSELTSSRSNVTNFGQANQRLETLISEIESTELTDTSALAEENNCKQQLNRKIKLCLKNQKIPASCQELVLKLWPNALFYILKNHGLTSEHWINAFDIYCELINSIQPVSNIDQYRTLKENFMSVARKNNNTLLLYHNESKVEPAIKALIAHCNHMLGAQKSYQQDTSQNEHSILEKISSLPPNVKPGVWCEIFIDEVTPPRRLRLSLINLETGTLMFVNRKGIKRLEKDALVFSEELRLGLSRIYKHDSLFSRPSTKTEYQKIG